MPSNPSIALIGLRGSGKTTVGRELAKIRGCDFVDTDYWIVRAALKTIAEIFAEEGEASFRAWEVEAIAQAVALGPAVISVGGGAVLDPQNVMALRGAATIVWLTAPTEVLWDRIQSDPASQSARPSLTNMSGLDEIRAMLAQRKAAYESAADVVIDTSNTLPQEIAEQIARRLA